MSRRQLGALAAGALFGAGLVVSGMTDPRNVIGFLDFSSRWNPNLIAAVVASPAAVTSTPTPVLIVAGVLVGFGTRVGGGCTSGHGVCGISRLSRASLVATATFIAAGAATVAVANHFSLFVAVTR